MERVAGGTTLHGVLWRHPLDERMGRVVYAACCGVSRCVREK